jgi:ribose transport system substrate-binding protein
MALGAVTAIKSAGKKPGTDVKVVSVDGTRNVVQAIVDGSVNADIESNPRFGPLAFQTLQNFYAGQPIPGSVVIEDKQYDKDNAPAEVASAY